MRSRPSARGAHRSRVAGGRRESCHREGRARSSFSDAEQEVEDQEEFAQELPDLLPPVIHLLTAARPSICNAGSCALPRRSRDPPAWRSRRALLGRTNPSTFWCCGVSPSSRRSAAPGSADREGLAWLLPVSVIRCARLASRWGPRAPGWYGMRRRSRTGLGPSPGLIRFRPGDSIEGAARRCGDSRYGVILQRRQPGRQSRGRARWCVRVTVAAAVPASAVERWRAGTRGCACPPFCASRRRSRTGSTRRSSAARRGIALVAVSVALVEVVRHGPGARRNRCRDARAGARRRSAHVRRSIRLPAVIAISSILIGDWLPSDEDERELAGTPARTMSLRYRREDARS